MKRDLSALKQDIINATNKKDLIKSSLELIEFSEYLAERKKN
jgi:hypothetical protein